MQPDALSENCGSRHFLSVIANKWSVLIIHAIARQGTARNGRLMREVEGISQKMLTQNLRNLEDLGIVARRDLMTIPPHVEYTLTAKGAALRAKVSALIRWVENNFDG